MNALEEGKRDEGRQDFRVSSNYVASQASGTGNIHLSLLARWQSGCESQAHCLARVVSVPAQGTGGGMHIHASQVCPCVRICTGSVRPWQLCIVARV